MPLQLRVSAGDHYHDLTALEEGASLIIGRSPDVDLSFPNDLQMSSRHLKLSIANGTCEIEDLGSTNGSFIEEEQITLASINPGDTFRCGATVFLLSGGAEETPAELAKEAKSPAMGTVQSMPFVGVSMQIEGFLEESAADVVTRFELGDEFPIAPDPDETPESFAKRLMQTGVPNHGVTFMAYALAKRAAVWWLTKCIEMVECLHDQRDEELLKVVQQWILDPNDTLRRHAMALAEGLEMSTPISWAGVGAFWSGGSMAPPNCPVVEPADNIFGKAISGGAILASVFNKPETAFDKQKAFVETGIDIASGKITLEPTG